MKARAIMKHRTAIERKTSTPDNSGGYTDAWDPIAADLPCFAWYVSSRMAILSDRPGVTETRFVLVPRTADVREGDRLTSVTDRKGRQIFAGPLQVDSVGERIDHKPLVTRLIL